MRRTVSAISKFSMRTATKRSVEITRLSSSHRSTIIAAYNCKSEHHNRSQLVQRITGRIWYEGVRDRAPHASTGVCAVCVCVVCVYAVACCAASGLEAIASYMITLHEFFSCIERKILSASCLGFARVRGASSIWQQIGTNVHKNIQKEVPIFSLIVVEIEVYADTSTLVIHIHTSRDFGSFCYLRPLVARKELKGGDECLCATKSRKWAEKPEIEHASLKCSCFSRKEKEDEKSLRERMVR